MSKYDTHLILNRGLYIDNKTGNIVLRGKDDNALLDSVENKEIFRNLYFSQNYALWDHFLTYTCNQKTYFGNALIKNVLMVVHGKIIFLNFIILKLLKINKLNKL